MQINFYKTRDKTLKKYINGYYFIKKSANLTSLKYRTFANNYNILSVCSFSEVHFEGNRIVVRSKADKELSVTAVFRYTDPIEIIYETAVEEITCYFEPLGLHHFIPEFHHILHHNHIANFSLFPDFVTRMIEVFNLTNRAQQIEALEEYWLSKLKEKDLSMMENILSVIETSDLKTYEVAQQFNLSRQYLHKLFIKYVGKPPSEYRKIHRFRSSIKRFKNLRNLRTLTFDHFFYDQPHFNKDFKELTETTPSTFFKNVNTEKEYIWYHTNVELC